jgi:ABC-type xylose transport system substrate-binding protein
MRKAVAGTDLLIAVAAVLGLIAPTYAADKKLFGVSWMHFNEERWSKYDKACMLDELKKYPDWNYIETDASTPSLPPTTERPAASLPR